jgi:NADH:ubiquinone oxidoreductase subunit 3 (subunit A)
MDSVWPYLTAILPTILVATLFYFLIRSMIEGDRRERLAQKRFESEQDARRDALSERAPTDGPAEDTGNGRGNSRADS